MRERRRLTSSTSDRYTSSKVVELSQGHVSPEEDDFVTCQVARDVYAGRRKRCDVRNGCWESLRGAARPCFSDRGRAVGRAELVAVRRV